MTCIECINAEVAECRLEEVVLGAVLEEVGLEAGSGHALVDLDCLLVVLQLRRELSYLKQQSH